MGVPARENDLLKLVHPRRHVEIYREPVIAAEIMKKYPRHCIARPDVFQFPWIAVHPESVLVPGKVFYLVPFRTMHKLLEAKKQQHNEHSSTRNLSDHHHRTRPHHRHHDEIDQNSPIKSMAGVTPKHRQHGSYSRQLDNMITGEFSGNHDHQDQDSDGSVYRSSFFQSWNTARENLHQETAYYQIDSLFDSVMTRNRRPRVTSPEHDDLQLRSCMKKPDSVRKLLKLKVTYKSPVVIPSTPRESPTLQQDVISS
ncbi:Uncharacterized protein Adt_30901 [Abeliophyllum distichum]|uniref:Uncharacterized protein n=1 Tax=Abeliophyllum distichum TaxID=126358 RepID=A0ABD1RCK2_9LAMI